MILVFAGAGASKAVDPRGYPTTAEFFQELPESITTNSLFKEVARKLEEDKGAPVDIEDLLWALGGMRNGLRHLGHREVLGHILMSAQKNPLVFEKRINLGDLPTTLPKIVADTKILVDEIHRQVFDLYSPLPLEKAVSETWGVLLNGLVRSDRNLQVFTTNYDSIIESSLLHEGLDFIKTGRQSMIYSNLDLQLWKADKNSLPRQLFTKLHGSVDWDFSSNGEAIRWGNPDLAGTVSRKCLIYPGFKGIPTEEPFASFHAHFERSIGLAKVLLFIGFAFRDDHINRLLRENVRSDAQIVILNPESNLPGLPFERDNVQHLPGRFDSSTAERTAQTVRAVMAGGEPLRV